MLARVRVVVSMLGICLSLILAGSARAEGGYLSVQYQYVEQEGFIFGDGETEVDLGRLIAQTLQFDLLYHLNDRWSVEVGLPIVRKRYNGPIRHDPLLLDNPRPDNEFLDDGSWQTNVANIELGLSRHFQYRDITISPFLRFEVPSHNYEVYGLAAAGDGLKKVMLGTGISAPIGLSNFYLRGEWGYTFSERGGDGINVNHHRFQAELGYFLNRRWTARVFALGRIGNGLDFPEDYPSLTDEIWYRHDQTMSHEFINVGVGFDYQVSARYNVSFWTQELVEGRNTNTTDAAYYLQVGYAF
ncbi:MAG: hypothetical protein AAGI15_01215 [Pseudomonadota bacterium]